NGGIFKATNAVLNATGDWNWTPITDNLPFGSAMGNLATGDLAMSPTAPETLYLGMGDPTPSEGGPSRGFFYTTDGGANWTKGGSLGNATHTWKIVPVDATTILVGTDDGLYRSTDGGVTMSRVAITSNEAGIAIFSMGLLADGTVVAAHGT